MSGHPNIYAAVVFDLHQKVRDYLDDLNNQGQIDLDEVGYPYLIGCDRQGPNFVVRIARNNQIEQFTINPRKKAKPICSWNPADGFQRPAQRQVMMVQAPETHEPDRRERARRIVPMEAIESLTESLFETDQREINGWTLSPIGSGTFSWEASGPDGYSEKFHSYDGARRHAMSSTRYAG